MHKPTHRDAHNTADVQAQLREQHREMVEQMRKAAHLQLRNSIEHALRSCISMDGLLSIVNQFVDGAAVADLGIGPKGIAVFVNHSGFPVSLDTPVHSFTGYFGNLHMPGGPPLVPPQPGAWPPQPGPYLSPPSLDHPPPYSPSEYPNNAPAPSHSASEPQKLIFPPGTPFADYYNACPHNMPGYSSSSNSCPPQGPSQGYQPYPPPVQVPPPQAPYAPQYPNQSSYPPQSPYPSQPPQPFYPSQPLPSQQPYYPPQPLQAPPQAYVPQQAYPGVTIHIAQPVYVTQPIFPTLDMRNVCIVYRLGSDNIKSALPRLKLSMFEMTTEAMEVAPGFRVSQNPHSRAPVYELFTSDETDITVGTFEYQRWYPIKGWSSHLLPTDRDNWSDRTGTLKRPREYYTLPNPQMGPWRWTGDWKMTGLNGDADGWMYAIDMPATYGAKTSTSFVRRRLWERTMTKRA